MNNGLVKYISTLFFILLFLTTGSIKVFHSFTSPGEPVYSIASAEDPEENNNKEEKPSKNAGEYYCYSETTGIRQLPATEYKKKTPGTGEDSWKAAYHRSIPTPPPERLA